MALELALEFEKDNSFIMNRIYLQFHDMIDKLFYEFKQEKKNEISQQLDQLMLEFKDLRDKKVDYNKNLEDMLKNVQLQITEGLSANGSIKAPKDWFQTKTKDFLDVIGRIIKQTLYIASYIVYDDKSSIKGKNRLSIIEEFFGPDHEYSKYMSKYTMVINDLFDMRSAKEHQDQGKKLLFDRFPVINPEGSLRKPSFSVVAPKNQDLNGKQIEIESFMNYSFDNLFSRSEAMILMSLDRIKPKNILIVNNDENEMYPYRAVAYFPPNN